MSDVVSEIAGYHVSERFEAGRLFVTVRLDGGTLGSGGSVATGIDSKLAERVNSEALVRRIEVQVMQQTRKGLTGEYLGPSPLFTDTLETGQGHEDISSLEYEYEHEPVQDDNAAWIQCSLRMTLYNAAGPVGYVAHVWFDKSP